MALMSAMQSVGPVVTRAQELCIFKCHCAV